MKKVYKNAKEALDGLLFDGMLIAAGGFGLCGIPELLIAAILPGPRIPEVVLLLGLGVVVGPDVLDIASTDPAVVLIANVGLGFLFFLAGLQSIPKSLIEAAAIDGARPWRRFWTIVFPLLSPTTFFLLVINIVYAFFDTFAIVDTATNGGPGKDTAILVYKVYYDGFKALDLGGSAAQSVVLMVIVIALTVVQFRYVEKKVQY